MELDKSLIKEFVSVTNDTDTSSKENTVYGTIVEYNGALCAQFDGSNMVTPVLTTTKVKVGDRVRITLKDHTATVTGNLSDPSASSEEVKELDKKVANFDIVIADIVTTEELNAEVAKIDKAIMDKADIKYATIENLTAANGEIDKLKTDKLDADTADIKYATIENLKAANGEIDNLKADKVSTDELDAEVAKIDEALVNKLDVNCANIDYANINKAWFDTFYAKSGLIQFVTSEDLTVTGHIVGVTISGDLIEAGTVKADKLVVRGNDGLYYKLNVSVDENGQEIKPDKVTDEELQNGLHGSNIIAKTITADRISVSDLVAFGAKIGGFTISDTAIYSGLKESIDNAADGTYLDKNGQVAFGDSDNYIKYFDETDGKSRLIICTGNFFLDSEDSVIELGKNNTDAVIKMCCDKGKIEYDANEEYLQITGDKVRIKGDDESTLYATYYDGINTSFTSGVHASPEQVHLYNSKGSGLVRDENGDLVGTFHSSYIILNYNDLEALVDDIAIRARRGLILEAQDQSGDSRGMELISANHISLTTSSGGNVVFEPSGKTLSTKPILIGNGKTGYNDGVPGWYFGIDGTTHVTRDTYGGYMYFHYNKSTSNTSSIGESSPGVISINGMPYGLNQILWSSDGYWMTANQTITLSQKISDQVNGVTLVFSRYLQDQTAAQNYNFTTCFVPKHQVNFYSGKGHMFTLASDSSFGLFGGKYLYISDTSIKGFDANQTSGTAASGIKYTNTSFVLRYVIGM